MQPEDDTWDATRYDRFRAQRERPALDLLAGLDPAPGGRVADLGCGSGRYTVLLHERTGADETLGIDSSRSMLDEAPSTSGVRFALGDLRDLEGTFDVLFANASLQWLPDHPTLLPRLAEHLRPGGQLAVQVPANFDHASHTVADEIGRRFGLEPLRRAIGALTPAGYAEVLHACGLRYQEVVLRIYGHEMARTDEVIAWVSGTLLTRFERQLDADAFAAFRDEYRRTLLDRLGDPSGERPYFYAFPRILFWARRR